MSIGSSFSKENYPENYDLPQIKELAKKSNGLSYLLDAVEFNFHTDNQSRKNSLLGKRLFEKTDSSEGSSNEEPKSDSEDSLVQSQTQIINPRNRDAYFYVPETPQTKRKVKRAFTLNVPSKEPVSQELIAPSNSHSLKLNLGTYRFFENKETNQGFLTFFGPDITKGSEILIRQGEEVVLDFYAEGSSFRLWLRKSEEGKTPFIIKMLRPSEEKDKEKIKFLKKVIEYKQLKEIGEKSGQFRVAELYNEDRIKDGFFVYEYISNSEPVYFEGIAHILREYLTNYNYPPIIGNFAHEKLRVVNNGLVLVSPTFKSIKNNDDLARRLAQVISSWMQNEDSRINMCNFGLFLQVLDTLKFTPDFQDIWGQVQLNLGQLLINFAQSQFPVEPERIGTP